ncbi:MAG: hypothetical protein OIF55_20595 [Amphritea sp.]|nr:hypothetical protein [Amphritea sp.]
MSDAYRRDCRKCNRPIIMTETINGWQPFELDGSGRHYCNNSAISTIYTPAPFNDFSERATRPTKCWWCDKPVFFHSNGNGDAVLLDELSGAPWPVHACWEKYKSDTQNIYNKIAEDPRIQKPRPELRSIGPYHSDQASKEIVKFSGCVVKSWQAKSPNDTNLPKDYKKLIISSGEKHGYVVVTKHIYNLIPDESLIDVDLFYLKGPDGISIPIAKKVRYESEGKARVKRMLKRHTPGECDYCGVIRKKGYSINNNWHVECDACHSLRGDCDPSIFLSAVKNIANHFYNANLSSNKKLKNSDS